VVDQDARTSAVPAPSPVGNHDAAVVRAAAEHGRRRAVVAWTRERSDTQIAFLARLPLSHARRRHAVVHANALGAAEWAYRGPRKRWKSLQATECRFTLRPCHVPAAYHPDEHRQGERVPSQADCDSASPHRQWLAIPRRGRPPRDGDPAACYAMFDTQGARADVPPRP
jgi:hypothetical protein